MIKDCSDLMSSLHSKTTDPRNLSIKLSLRYHMCDQVPNLRKIGQKLWSLSWMKRLCGHTGYLDKTPLEKMPPDKMPWKKRHGIKCHKEETPPDKTVDKYSSTTSSAVAEKPRYLLLLLLYVHRSHAVYIYHLTVGHCCLACYNETQTNACHMKSFSSTHLLTLNIGLVTQLCTKL